jgi:hypothetical protein
VCFSQIRFISKLVQSSPQRSEIFKTTVRQLLAELNASREEDNEPPININQAYIKNLILDVKTRWNSTLAMLMRALEYRDAIDRLCTDTRRSKCAIFHRYGLSEEDWKVLAVVAEWLKVRSYSLI